jgi:predicted nucleic acid-binding protein
MKRVYVETSVVSYYCARSSRDLIVAAHQQITREWWETRLLCCYQPFVSEIVAAECARGDAAAAMQRLQAIGNLPRISAATGEGERLARQYVETLGIPEFAFIDALHIALAVLGNMDYLVTWNCSHIANGATIARLLEFNRSHGLYECVICTPEELMEGEP